MNLKFSLRAKMLIYILLTITISVIAVIFLVGRSLKQSSLEKNKELALTSAKAEINNIKADLNTEMILVHALSNSILSFSNVAPNELISSTNELLRNTLLNKEEYYSVWVNWELDYINANWNKPYGREKHIFFKEEGKIKYDLEILDTISEDYETYYYKAKTAGRELLYINESNIEFDNKDFIVTFAVPLKDKGKYIGLVGIDISLQKFINFSETEEGIIKYNQILISNNGLILKHPKSHLINKDISHIFENEIEEHRIYDKINNGIGISFMSVDYSTKERSFNIFEPIKISNSIKPWSLLIQVPFDTYLKKANDQLKIAIIVGIIILLIISIIVWIIARNIAVPLSKTTKILKALAQGDINTSYKLEVDTKDEIGEMSESVNSLIDGLNLTANFAKEIGRGNLSSQFEKLSENDVLGQSLIEMKESLDEAKKEEEKRKIEDAKQNWATQGLAKFSDILRESAENLEDLSYSILSNLVKYIDANQGGLFIINEDDNKEKYIELIGCYAYERKKFVEKKIAFGEGLVGRCVLEKETIHMTDVPEDYINITSGLGKDNPRSLLIVPLILNEEVYGVIEMASFKDFEPHVVSFVEKIGQSIASTISNVKINLRTAQLLEESRIQAEELAAQEEEMRQNLEELQATQEESARKEAEMSGMLAAMNASLLVMECDIEGKIISINNNFSRIIEQQKDEIIGKSYKNTAVSLGMKDEKIDKAWKSLLEGEIVKNIVQLNINENEVWINQTYAPIVNNEGKPYKVLNIGIDITETKNQEKQVQRLLEESQEQNKELQRLKEEDERKTKEMLETVEAHRKTLKEIIDQIPGKVFLKDKDGKMVIVNKAVEIAHNCDAEELIGKSDLDFFEDNPELARKLWEEEQEIIRTGAKTFEQKEYVNDADMYLKTTKMPFYIHYMDQTGLLGIQLDITDIKEMQLEIEKQNKELIEVHEEMEKEKLLMDCMMENVPDNIYFKDRESRFLRISRNMLGLFRVKSYDKVLGKRDFDFFSEEHAQQAFNDEQKIIRTGKPIIGLIEKETFEDGSESWADTTKMPLLDKDGNIIGTFGISRNVTEIKKMEVQAKEQSKKLQQNEEEMRQTIEELKATQDELLEKQELLMWESSMFNTLMNHLPDRISFKDREGKFRRVNAAKSIKHGIVDPKDIIGKSDYDFFSKEHADKAYKEEQDLLRSGAPIIDLEERIVWKDGKITWGSTSRIPFANDKGNIIGSFVMTKDITEIKLAKAEIQNNKIVINGVAANTPILIYKVDFKGIIKEIKGLGLKLMGTEEMKITGKDINSVFTEVEGKLGKKRKDGITFRTKGTHNKIPWEMEHYLFTDQTTEGGIIGYAFKTKLI